MLPLGEGSTVRAGGGNSFSYSRMCRVPPGRKSIVCSRTLRPERSGGWDNEGVDKLKWSGASALAINKATCRQDRAYTCFRRIRSAVIFIENWLLLHLFFGLFVNALFRLQADCCWDLLSWIIEESRGIGARKIGLWIGKLFDTWSLWNLFCFYSRSYCDCYQQKSEISEQGGLFWPCHPRLEILF